MRILEKKLERQHGDEVTTYVIPWSAWLSLQAMLFVLVATVRYAWTLAK